MKKLFTMIALLGAFAGASAQTVAGGDMETWIDYKSSGTSLVRPNNWFSSDSLIKAYYLLTGSTSSFVARCSKSSTIKHGGSLSAAVISTSVDTLPSILANSNITFNLTDLMAGKFLFKYPGGTPVTKRVVWGHAWVYVQSTGSSDIARMNLTAIKSGIGAGGSDSTIGQGYLDIPSNTGFQKIDVAINYKDATTVPDRIVISFVPTIKPKPVDGTTIWVDDVTLSDPTGIETPIYNATDIRVFPNPVHNQLTVSTDRSEAMSVSVFAVNGQELMRASLQGNTNIDVSKLPAGNYVYVVGSSDFSHKYYSGTFTKN
jgi:hypothetical protein